MKSILGNQQFAKCNFCLNWFKTKDDTPSLNALAICQSCFDKGRKTSCFKVMEPRSWIIYELHFKKSPIEYSETQCAYTSELLEISDLYQKNTIFSENHIKSLKCFLNEIVEYERETIDRLQPIKDFVNNLYKKEILRVEEIWDGVCKQLQQISDVVTKYRIDLGSRLRSNINNISISNSKDLMQQFRLELMKSEVQKKLSWSLEELQQKCVKGKHVFFENGFKLLENKRNSQPLQSNEYNIQIPSEYFHYKKKTNKFKEIKQKARGNLLDSSNKENYCIDQTNTSRTKYRNNFKSPENTLRVCKSKATLKKDKSIESILSLDYITEREIRKNNILECLKNRSTAQNLTTSYKSNGEKVENTKVLPDRIMTENIYQALETTFNGHNLIELVAYRTQFLEFQCFMQMIDWRNGLEIVKFVKVALTDDHLNILLSHLRKSKSIHTLVITNNLLTDESLEILMNFCRQQEQLKNIYIGRNYIKIFKCKALLSEFKNLGVNIFI